jgi:hypothetical protein
MTAAAPAATVLAQPPARAAVERAALHPAGKVARRATPATLAVAASARQARSTAYRLWMAAAVKAEQTAESPEAPRCMAFPLRRAELYFLTF